MVSPDRKVEIMSPGSLLTSCRTTRSSRCRGPRRGGHGAGTRGVLLRGGRLPAVHGAPWKAECFCEDTMFVVRRGCGHLKRPLERQHAPVLYELHSRRLAHSSRSSR